MTQRQVVKEYAWEALAYPQVEETFHMTSLPFWIDSLAWLGWNRYRNAEIPSTCSVKKAAKITYCGR